MKIPRFNYKCPECGKGMVRTERFKDYPTKVKGIPFLVPFAYIGVCSACGRKNFNAAERQRWEKIFYNKASQRSALRELQKKVKESAFELRRLQLLTRKTIRKWDKRMRLKP